MIWSYFVTVAIITIAVWLLSVVLFLLRKHSTNTLMPFGLAIAGSTILLAFVIMYWIDIQRPPMRTMAETRLWYSLLVSIVSIVVFRIYHSKVMLSLGLVMSSVFLIADILHPEYQSRNLMPALQSVWFIPHVVVYMVSYAILGSASILAIAGIFRKSVFETHVNQAMQLVYPGFAALTFGMLLGAFWAKFAWGDYWAWDPKEIWALITWLFYLMVIHIHRYFSNNKKLLHKLLVLSFAVLLFTWLGIKYLPAASQSIHVYAN